MYSWDSSAASGSVLSTVKYFFFKESKEMHSLTDRPGRFFALVVMPPTLVHIGTSIQPPHPVDSARLQTLGTLLFVYELFWVTRTSSEILTHGQRLSRPR